MIISAWMAAAFGIFLAVAEVARNWGDWGYWPFWLVDYIAASLLLLGAWRTLRATSGRDLRLLPGAWGFTCAMFYGSFFSHIQTLSEPARGPIEHLPLTISIGVLFAATIVGLMLSLVGSDGTPSE